MSFPPGTEMFQFPGFAFIPYGFRNKYLLLISASPKIARLLARKQPARRRLRAKACAASP